VTDDRKPLDEFRAYYTRDRAAGSEDVAIKLAQEETGLYSALQKAFFAGWKARGEVPPPPPEVPQGVLNALSTLRAHFEAQTEPTVHQKAVAAGLGALSEAQNTHVESLPALPAPVIDPTRPPVHQPEPVMYQPGPPPVTYLSDYAPDEPQPGAHCPTCQSAERETRLGVWSESFGEHAACPDKWHGGGFSIAGAVTGRFRKVASSLTEKDGS
jgi:hypothetical protein